MTGTPVTFEPFTFASRRAAREAEGGPEEVRGRASTSVSELYRQPVTIPGSVPVKDRKPEAIVVPRAGGRA